jgi:hypothetical protein
MFRVMTVLEAGSAQEVLDHFGGFFDAVVVEIHIAMPRDLAGRHALVRLLAQDARVVGDEASWRSVTLRVNGLSAFKVIEGPACYSVLSDGLRVHPNAAAGFVVDLAPVTDAAWGGEPRFDRSNFYFVGSGCSYEVTDPDE